MIGGGFPEIHAEALSANVALRREIVDLVAAGGPIAAECAGLLYLASALDGAPMCGVFDATAQMTKRLTIGYREAVAVSDSPLVAAGTRMRGHEFHRTVCAPSRGEQAAWVWPMPGNGELPTRVTEGFVTGPTSNVHASYLHLHWAGNPDIAARFVDGGRERSARRGRTCRRSSAMTRWPDGIDLSHHGDADSAPGLVDLAVNVRHGARPAWLAATLRDAMGRLDRYPVAVAAREAVARRHGRDPNEVLLTSGAAEAFVLLARVLRPRRAVVVHPQFTEPEAALRAAGHPVERSVLDWPFRLTSTPTVIPEDADLVVIGNPTNPTSVLHPAGDLVGLCKPGRTLVVDEAFADCVPGEGESLAGRSDLPGVVVIRSLTKTWGLAGLRCGYVLAARALVEELAAAQPLWPLSTPALAAIEVCSSPLAVATAERYARELVEARSSFVAALTARASLRVVPDPAGSFVLVDHGGDDGVRQRLRDAGFVVRRGDTFPGLGESWIRVAVRDPETSARFLHAFDAARALAVGG